MPDRLRSPGQQPGTNVYTTDLDEGELRQALAKLGQDDRFKLLGSQQSKLRMFLALKEGPGSTEAVNALRKIWQLPKRL